MDEDEPTKYQCPFLCLLFDFKMVGVYFKAPKTFSLPPPFFSFITFICLLIDLRDKEWKSIY